MTPATRDLVPAELDWMVPLNNAAVPAVPPMDAASLGAVLAHADLAIAVVDADAPDAPPLGMLLAMQPGGAYDSANYRWFEERGADGLYVDRIVVADGHRGLRLGQVLYARVFAEARRTGRAAVTCEVNTLPPNPGSLAFHGRLGFARVGELVDDDGLHAVAMMSAPADASASDADASVSDPAVG
ncbi:GNAT family N-acetyltransferase [Clavibacter sp. km1a]|uniref:GNAT family N-acetyltransferase n=1 Tax=Clavibacter sp. km1a TaxID=3459136 RepID=UPI0040436962